jgi:hypothetical protein
MQQGLEWIKKIGFHYMQIKKARLFKAIYNPDKLSAYLAGEKLMSDTDAMLKENGIAFSHSSGASAQFVQHNINVPGVKSDISFVMGDQDWLDMFTTLTINLNKARGLDVLSHGLRVITNNIESASR